MSIPRLNFRDLYLLLGQEDQQRLSEALLLQAEDRLGHTLKQIQDLREMPGVEKSLLDDAAAFAIEGAQALTALQSLHDSTAAMPLPSADILPLD